MDKLNEPSKMEAIAFEDIPTPEEHAREVRRIFTVCGSIAILFMLSAVTGIVIAVRSNVPLPVIAAVAVMSSFICIVSFGIGYACPVGLVSLRRLEIAYRMGYFGTSQNRRAVGAMEDIAKHLRKEMQPLPSGRRPVVEE